jgi:hypothetical protein
MSWNKWFLKFQRLVALSKCWEPPHIVTQHHSPQDHSPHIHTCCLPGHTEVAFLPPHPSIVFTWVCSLLTFFFVSPLFVLGMFVKVIRTTLE